VRACQAVKLWGDMRRYLLGNTPPEKQKYLRNSQVWPEDLTFKLFCNMETWRTGFLEVAGGLVQMY
jgi:hypothetical protein